MNDGNVWKKSQTESINLVASSLRAHIEPTTIPNIADKKTIDKLKF